MDYFDIPKFWVVFDGSCLKPDAVTFTSNAIMNLYISYEIKLWHYHNDTGFLLRSSIFGAVKLTKNADADK